MLVRLTGVQGGGSIEIDGTDKVFSDDNLGTVDGSHPTDLGFMRMADAFGRVLEPLTRDDDAP